MADLKTVKQEGSTCHFIFGFELKKTGILRGTEISAFFPRLSFFGNEVTVTLITNPLF